MGILGIKRSKTEKILKVLISCGGKKPMFTKFIFEKLFLFKTFIRFFLLHFTILFSIDHFPFLKRLTHKIWIYQEGFSGFGSRQTIRPESDSKVEIF